MRNLKRVLSLALASIMLLGMMVVGAGAASKDFTGSGFYHAPGHDGRGRWRCEQGFHRFR